VIAAIVHGDLDGLVSAAILSSYMRNKNKRVKIYTTQPYLLPQALLRLQNLRNLESLFIIDLGLDVHTWNRIKYLIRTFSKFTKVIWIDHHIATLKLAMELLDFNVSLIFSIDRCASTATYYMFGKGTEDPIFFAKLAKVGEISDKVVVEDVDNELKEITEKLILALSENPSDDVFKLDLIKLWVINHKFLDDEVEIRASIASKRLRELRKIAQNNMVYQSENAIIIDFRTVNAIGYIGLLASQLADEFKKNTFIVFTSQNELVVTFRAPTSASVDLSDKLMEIARKYGGSGGGHPRAFSIRIPITLGQNIIDELIEQFRAKQ